MRICVTWYGAILLIASLWMRIEWCANAEGVLVDRVTFDGDLDSEFGVVEVISRGGTSFRGTRYSAMGESVSLSPSIDEKYLSISGFDDALTEGTITFWAQARGRGSAGGLRVFEMSSQGTKAAAAHTFSLHTDSAVEVTLLNHTFHNQSFHSRIEQHDPYQWNLYSYSYSKLTGEVKVAVNSEWIMEFNLAADALIEASTVIQIGRVEIGSGNGLGIDDIRVYSGQLTSEDLRSILREPELSLDVVKKDNGVELTVIDPAGNEYAIERNGDLRSSVWDHVFTGDRTRTSQTFFDSAFRARNGLFYRLRFPR